MIDVQATVAEVRAYLQARDFRPRDADITDYQSGRDASLRFKTGTSRGEVTVTVWRYARQIEVMRIISPTTMAEALTAIDQYVHEFREARRV